MSASYIEWNVKEGFAEFRITNTNPTVFGYVEAYQPTGGGVMYVARVCSGNYSLEAQAMPTLISGIAAAEWFVHLMRGMARWSESLR